MRYVILRDDDTNALTPVDCLERLYRPFLDRGLPVNLATIPKVRTDTTGPNGLPEGYLVAKARFSAAGDLLPITLPLAANQELVRYLRGQPGYHIVQHGYHHSLFEFDSEQADDVSRRLERGTQLLQEAGFPEPTSFVAPYDRLSATSLSQAARRFRVLSTGWFERRRLPVSWWPRYAWKKILRRSHWRIHRTLLLTHPGCLLSYQRPYVTMLDEVKRAVLGRRLTVLVTHWWEYFRGTKSDERFIQILHDTAAWLASQPDIQVVSFDDVASGKVPLQ